MTDIFIIQIYTHHIICVWVSVVYVVCIWVMPRWIGDGV